MGGRQWIMFMKVAIVDMLREVPMEWWGWGGAWHRWRSRAEPDPSSSVRLCGRDPLVPPIANEGPAPRSRTSGVYVDSVHHYGSIFG